MHKPQRDVHAPLCGREIAVAESGAGTTASANVEVVMMNSC